MNWMMRNIKMLSRNKIIKERIRKTTKSEDYPC